MADERSLDVLIAGGGPVGGALAALLGSSGLDVALVTPPPRPRSAAVPRPVALSAPSHALMRGLGLAGAVDFTPIETIHVSQRGGFGRTVIRAAEQGVPALGYVCDLARLADAVADAPIGSRIAGAVTRWETLDDRVRVEAADADGVMRTFDTQLLVVADGGASDDAVTEREYEQTAIVCTIRSAVPHRGVAWERFTAEGPLALLPCQDRYAVVWSMQDAHARALMSASDDRFAAALGAAFGTRLGTLSDPGPRGAYPLALKRSIAPASRGVIRIGNAAQTLHPVAGQGLNLGLRDAQVLADRILRAAPGALGNDRFAAEYLASRAFDRIMTVGATDFLARIFALDSAPLRAMRGAGLAFLDAFPPARKFLARRMMLGTR